MMKIAFVYDAIYSWIKGGAEKRIYEIGRRLADKHEVHWYGIRWWEGKETIEQNNPARSLQSCSALRERKEHKGGYLLCFEVAA